MKRYPGKKLLNLKKAIEVPEDSDIPGQNRINIYELMVFRHQFPYLKTGLIGGDIRASQ